MLAEWGGNLSPLLLFHHSPISIFFFFFLHISSFHDMGLLVYHPECEFFEQGRCIWLLRSPPPHKSWGQVQILKRSQIKWNELYKLQRHSNVADVFTGDQHTGWRQRKCQSHWGACFQPQVRAAQLLCQFCEEGVVWVGFSVSFWVLQMWIQVQ